MHGDCYEENVLGRAAHEVQQSPFAWREALTPTVSPAASARGSRAGSRQHTPTGGSAASTPRSITPTHSPKLARPPVPWSGGGHVHGDVLSARTPSYATPEPTFRSAHSCDFLSVHGSSTPPTARLGSGEFDTLYEDGAAQYSPAPRQRACAAAALAAFAAAPATLPAGYYPDDALSPSASVPSPLSLDPRAIFSSARHGKHKEVEAALAAGFDPAHADSFGNTLFHIACQNGNKRIAKAAIKYGGDMDAQNGKGHTGLHFLFSYGYPDIAEYFIEKGANEHIQNESGKVAREGIR